MEARITLSYKDEEVAKAIVQGVSPDNVRIPPSLTIEMTRKGAKVVTRVKCEGGLGTFIATLDDLLMAVQVAERAVSASRPSP